MRGKHTDEAQKIKQLEETIKLRDKEIKDIKFSVSDILLQIRTLNESNDYGDPSQRKRKISELCTETRYQLLVEEIDNFYKKEKQQAFFLLYYLSLPGFSFIYLQVFNKVFNKVYGKK